MAERLRVELARHNVPSYVCPLSDRRVAVSLWRGLVARTDGEIIWWTVPHLSRSGRALCTFAFSPVAAAERISVHYRQVRARDPEPAELLPELTRATLGPGAAPL